MIFEVLRRLEKPLAQGRLGWSPVWAKMTRKIAKRSTIFIKNTIRIKQHHENIWLCLIHGADQIGPCNLITKPIN
ncbi:hypothetical protein LAZ67_17002151 [Cordylochernes scorpioides]|uniref:Uncharacterized protein n=1 Tax=Cordylochernes scorpioides TaxID=51811 RepID=A0ABY6LHZ5_9ARAC|nr:hypothetical protein LAZ67_17002151 [Cordylochernes scorpioides]